MAVYNAHELQTQTQKIGAAFKFCQLGIFLHFCIEFRHLKRTGLKIAIFELISMNFESEVVEFPNRFFNCVYQIGFSMDCL